MIIFDPIECASCDSLFCKECIETWKFKYHNCPKKCNEFQPKKINRILKN